MVTFKVGNLLVLLDMIDLKAGPVSTFILSHHESAQVYCGVVVYPDSKDCALLEIVGHL